MPLNLESNNPTKTDVVPGYDVIGENNQAVLSSLVLDEVDALLLVTHHHPVPHGLDAYHTIGNVLCNMFQLVHTC